MKRRMLMAAVAACLVMVGCMSPTPEEIEAKLEAQHEDQVALDKAIQTYGIVYVADASSPFTVTYTDEKGVEHSEREESRFWYAFTPPQRGHLLKVFAQRSSTVTRDGYVIQNPNDEVWVRIYANGTLAKEDRKVGVEAYIASITARW